MNDEWKESTLDDLCTLITDGKHGDCKNQPGSGFYFLSVKDVIQNQLRYDSARQITKEDFAETHRRTNLKPGDILFTNTGTIGRMAIAPDDSKTYRTTFQKSVAILSPKREIIDSRFLYYSLRARNADLSSLAAGTTQVNLLLKDIRSFRIRVPELVEQRRIVWILAALDDKIDLNRSMNETLEAMARAIFQDWFVDFGPTRAKMEGRAPYLVPEIWSLFPDLPDAEGKPQGWAASTVGAEFSLIMGQSPPGETYNEKGEGLPFFQGRTDFGARYPKRRMFCSAPTRIAEVDDTLVSVRAPVGDLNMAWERCCVGRGVAAVRHLSGHRGYTYYSLSNLQPDLAAFEHTGTVFGAINKAQFEILKIVAPDPRVVNTFEALVSGLDERIRSNEIETETLAATRDLLLPKLVSGEIRISDSEKTIETQS
jgi:type I restriction enzyme S subunit